MLRALLVLLLFGCAPPAPGVVYVVPIGAPSPAELARAAWAAGRETGREVRVLPARPAPPPGADGRVSAGALLDGLVLGAPADAFRVVGVTDRPLGAPEEGEVIGYARLGERALVYSTDALSPGGDEAERRARTRRLVAHELGHTHGAGHCRAGCLMASAGTVRDLDHLADDLCPAHRARALAALQAVPGDPDWQAGVARERLRLGRFEDAVAHLREAVSARPGDDRLRTTLGVALMARGDLSAADAVLATAPDAPGARQARAALAAAAGDPARAVALLDAAVDPRRGRAAGVAYARRAVTTITFVEPEIVVAAGPLRVAVADPILPRRPNER